MPAFVNKITTTKTFPKYWEYIIIDKEREENSSSQKVFPCFLNTMSFFEWIEIHRF